MRACLAISTILAVGLSACAPAADEAESDSATTEGTSEDSDGQQAPEAFAETAWRITAEDGARYVTYFDVGGTYRDLRNGDPWQQGEWTYADGPSGKQLCMLPASGTGVESCWQPGKVNGDTMIATGPEDRRIELTRVTYEAPAASEGPEEE